RGVPSLIVGLLGLILAGVGEALVELKDAPQVKNVPPIASLGFYVLGIGLFVLSARGGWLALSRGGEAERIGADRRRWIVLGLGLVVSIGLCAWSTQMIVKDLKTTTG